MHKENGICKRLISINDDGDHGEHAQRKWNMQKGN